MRYDGSPVQPTCRLIAVRTGLAASLRAYEQIMVVGATRGDLSAFEMLRHEPPDVLLIDIRGQNSLAIAQHVHGELPAVKVIAFAVDEREPQLFTFAKAGVAGYVSADASVEELVTIIRNTASEDFACSPRITSALLRALTSGVDGDSTGAEYATLTARQREVLRLMCKGLSNKEIAQSCNIAEATVKNHVHHVLEKLKAANRCQAAARAGLVSWPARG